VSPLGNVIRQRAMRAAEARVQLVLMTNEPAASVEQIVRDAASDLAAALLHGVPLSDRSR